MSLRIVKPGICTSVQDMGRNGYRALGITPGGAMDVLAAALANYIAGNDEAEAVIEINFPAPVIVFEQPAIAAVAGADFSATLNGLPLVHCKPFFVQPGDVLAFEKKVWGAWAYIAVHGGIEAEKWLGSCATDTAAAAGGHKGRLLQKEDVLAYQKTAPLDTVSFSWQLAEKEWGQWYNNNNTIAVLPGNELALLPDDEQKKLFSASFAVAQQSNRMGYRLSGPPLQLKRPAELISSAVTKGTVQLLPSGECIVLMAGCQTTGGYPRMAHVTAAAMPAMAQAQRTAVNFRLVSIEAAEESLFSMQQWLKQVKQGCFEKYAANKEW
jgi:antagonist of KipI